MLKNLSDLGMGKKESMEDVISHDAQQIVDKICEQEGKPLLIKVRNLFISCERDHGN